MDHLTPDDLLIRESPRDDESWFDNSDVDKASGSREIRLERFQTLEHVIREHPINVDPYLELARIYLQKSRWVDAKRILDLAVAKFPEDEDANFLLEEAQINRSLQLLDEARRAHRAEPTRLTQEALDRCNLELNVLREKVCRSRLIRD
ncbi:MAG: tetratricopeptide repeat protein, partial [bacterium]|nr:tetratricopeptide repeat protein [bacterium]